MKCKNNMFLNFQTLFLKRYIFEVVEVFSRLVLIQSIQLIVFINKIHNFDEAFFLVATVW